MKHTILFICLVAIIYISNAEQVCVTEKELKCVKRAPEACGSDTCIYPSYCKYERKKHCKPKSINAEVCESKDVCKEEKTPCGEPSLNLWCRFNEKCIKDEICDGGNCHGHHACVPLAPEFISKKYIETTCKKHHTIIQSETCSDLWEKVAHCDMPYFMAINPAFACSAMKIGEKVCIEGEIRYKQYECGPAGFCCPPGALCTQVQQCHTVDKVIEDCIDEHSGTCVDNHVWEKEQCGGAICNLGETCVTLDKSVCHEKETNVVTQTEIVHGHAQVPFHGHFVKPVVNVEHKTEENVVVIPQHGGVIVGDGGHDVSVKHDVDVDVDVKHKPLPPHPVVGHDVSVKHDVDVDVDVKHKPLPPHPVVGHDVSIKHDVDVDVDVKHKPLPNVGHKVEIEHEPSHVVEHKVEVEHKTAHVVGHKVEIEHEPSHIVEHKVEIEHEPSHVVEHKVEEEHEPSHIVEHKKKEEEEHEPSHIVEHKKKEEEDHVPVNVVEHKKKEDHVPVIIAKHKKKEEEEHVPVIIAKHEKKEEEDHVPVIITKHEKEEEEEHVPVIIAKHEKKEEEDHVPVIITKHKKEEEDHVPVIISKHKKEEEEDHVPVNVVEHKKKEKHHVPVIIAEHKKEKHHVPVIIVEHKKEKHHIPVVIAEHKKKEEKHHVPVIVGHKKVDDHDHHGIYVKEDKDDHDVEKKVIYLHGKGEHEKHDVIVKKQEVDHDVEFHGKHDHEEPEHEIEFKKADHAKSKSSASASDDEVKTESNTFTFGDAEADANAMATVEDDDKKLGSFSKSHSEKDETHTVGVTQVIGEGKATADADADAHKYDEEEHEIKKKHSKSDSVSEADDFTAYTKNKAEAKGDDSTAGAMGESLSKNKHGIRIAKGMSYASDDDTETKTLSGVHGDGIAYAEGDAKHSGKEEKKGFFHGHHYTKEVAVVDSADSSSLSAGHFGNAYTETDTNSDNNAKSGAYGEVISFGKYKHGAGASKSESYSDKDGAITTTETEGIGHGVAIGKATGKATTDSITYKLHEKPRYAKSDSDAVSTPYFTKTDVDVETVGNDIGSFGYANAEHDDSTSKSFGFTFDDEAESNTFVSAKNGKEAFANADAEFFIHG